jgi:hypothetical protein
MISISRWTLLASALLAIPAASVSAQQADGQSNSKSTISTPPGRNSTGLSSEKQPGSSVGDSNPKSTVSTPPRRDSTGLPSEKQSK